MKNKLIAIGAMLMLLAIPLGTVSATQTYSVIGMAESGLPANTEWSYMANGVIYNTTSNTVVFKSAETVQVIPLTGFTLATSVSGQFLYVNFTQTGPNSNSIGATLPYLVLFMIIGFTSMIGSIVITRRR